MLDDTAGRLTNRLNTVTKRRFAAFLFRRLDPDISRHVPQPERERVQNPHREYFHRPFRERHETLQFRPYRIQQLRAIHWLRPRFHHRKYYRRRGMPLTPVAVPTTSASRRTVIILTNRTVPRPLSTRIRHRHRRHFQRLLISGCYV